MKNSKNDFEPLYLVGIAQTLNRLHDVISEDAANYGCKQSMGEILLSIAIDILHEHSGTKRSFEIATLNDTSDLVICFEDEDRIPQPTIAWLDELENLEVISAEDMPSKPRLTLIK